MATTYVQDGDVLTLTAPAGGVTAGTPVLIGSLFVIPKITAAVGAEFSADVVGVHTLAKTSAQAWTEGQKIYWDDGNSRCDSDGTLGQLIGVAEAVAANPSATGVVRLNGVAPGESEGPQPAIVSLTDNSGGSDTPDDTIAEIADIALSTSDTYTDAAVNAAVNAVVDDCANAIEECAAKINEILVALRAHGVISS